MFSTEIYDSEDIVQENILYIFFIHIAEYLV